MRCQVKELDICNITCILSCVTFHPNVGNRPFLVLLFGHDVPLDLNHVVSHLSVLTIFPFAHATFRHSTLRGKCNAQSRFNS